MALITRLQWTLIRIGLVQTWTQALFVVALVLAIFFGVTRQNGISALANVSVDTGMTTLLGMAPAPTWETVYEHDDIAIQAHVETTNTLRANEQRQAKFRKTMGGSQNGTTQDISKSGEALLMEAYRLQNEGHYTQALQVAQKMVERFPNFQLGQLVYADLMASMTPRTTDKDHLLNSNDIQERLSQLKNEAIQRRRHANYPDLSGSYPAPLRYLSPSVQKIVVVDAKKSRLYLLEQRSNGMDTDGMQVVFDAYVSIGNKGIGKWREGDAKTPTGVYFVQKHMTAQMLPDLYGSGALTLDYPNPLDTQQKRTGSGIWLHGSPSQQYARPPMASDGCVVLANDDMLRLVQRGVGAGTPIIIAEQMNWKTLGSGETMIKSPTEWPLPQHAQQIPGIWKLLSAFEWKDKDRQVAVLSYEILVTGQAPQKRHSYWMKDQEQWKEVIGPA